MDKTELKLQFNRVAVGDQLGDQPESTNQREWECNVGLNIQKSCASPLSTSDPPEAASQKRRKPDS